MSPRLARHAASVEELQTTLDEAMWEPIAAVVSNDTEVRLGSPMGVLTLADPSACRDLLLVAGSTGLAPLKAIIGQVAGLPD